MIVQFLPFSVTFVDDSAADFYFLLLRLLGGTLIYGLLNALCFTAFCVLPSAVLWRVREEELSKPSEQTSHMNSFGLPSCGFLCRWKRLLCQSFSVLEKIVKEGQNLHARSVFLSRDG